MLIEAGMSIRPERAKGKRLLGLMPLPSQEPVEWIRPYSQGEKGVAMEKAMKRRRHHNNKGTRQIKNGKTAKDLFHIARRLGLAKVFKGKEEQDE